MTVTAIRETEQTGLAVNLRVLDRLALLSILPAQGNFVTLKAVRVLREMLSNYTDEEREALAFKVEDNGSMHWQETADTGWDFSLNGAEVELIVGALRKADREQKLTEDHMGAYEKFMGGD